VTQRIPQPPARTSNAQPTNEKVLCKKTYPITKIFDAMQLMNTLFDAGFTGQFIISGSQGSVMYVVTEESIDSGTKKNLDKKLEVE
jgi:hypothetical protein